ncbi:MAG: MerR family transcriptional regulator [Chloroflexi bacterium]|nr:MerR family transcriptional regulator [Chloroflexota bacterium]
MKSKEAQTKTGLTRKAIEYYEAQGLLNPSRDENGYRNYSDQDVLRLSQISGYRKLGLNLSEITDVLLSNNKKETISNIVREKEIRNRMEEKRLRLLSQVASGNSFEEIEDDLISLESQESIYNRISKKFPGYIGQMFFVNYAPFLQGRLETTDQLDAFNQLIRFLDQMEDLPFTEEEMRTIQEASESITIENMESIVESKLQAVQDAEKWMEENHDIIQRYQEFKNSEDYQSMSIVKLFEKMKQFLQESDYYEVVNPLLRKMSPSYDKYYQQLSQSNEYFMKNLDK